jgi:hypothetical protein
MATPECGMHEHTFAIIRFNSRTYESGGVDAEFRCFRHLKVWNTDVSQMSSNGFIVCGWTFLECDHGVDRSIPVQREVLAGRAGFWDRGLPKLCPIAPNKTIWNRTERHTGKNASACKLKRITRSENEWVGLKIPGPEKDVPVRFRSRAPAN